MNFKTLFDKWREFKEERRAKPNISSGNPCFLSMKQREKLIDILFKELEKLNV